MQVLWQLHFPFHGMFLHCNFLFQIWSFFPTWETVSSSIWISQCFSLSKGQPWVITRLCKQSSLYWQRCSLQYLPLHRYWWWMSGVKYTSEKRQIGSMFFWFFFKSRIKIIVACIHPYAVWNEVRKDTECRYFGNFVLRRFILNIAVYDTIAFFMYVINKSCVSQIYIYLFSVEHNLLVCPARIFKIHHFCLFQWPEFMSAIYPLHILIGVTPGMNLAAQYWNEPVVHLDGYASLITGQCLMSERQTKLFLIKPFNSIIGLWGKNNIFSYAH